MQRDAVWYAVLCHLAILHNYYNHNYLLILVKVFITHVWNVFITQLYYGCSVIICMYMPVC